MVAARSAGLSEALALFVLVIGLCFVVPRVRAIWTGERMAELLVPRWWLWGSSIWRAMVRASAAFLLVVITLVFTGTIVVIGGDGSDGSSSIRDWMGFIGFVGFIGSLVLSFLVVLFNRPRALVPPRFRGESGLV